MEKPVLSPDFLRELATENPLGITIEPKEVRAWFDYIAWPSFKTYKYKNHKRAIRRWWAHLRWVDLQRAREATQRHKDEKLQKIQDKINLEEIVGRPIDEADWKPGAVIRIMGRRP